MAGLGCGGCRPRRVRCATPDPAGAPRDREASDVPIRVPNSANLTLPRCTQTNRNAPKQAQKACESGTSKPAGPGSPRVGRFDSFAAPWAVLQGTHPTCRGRPRPTTATSCAPRRAPSVRCASTTSRRARSGVGPTRSPLQSHDPQLPRRHAWELLAADQDLVAVVLATDRR